MRRNEPQHISEIIREAIRRSGAQDNFERQRACYLWTEVVGPGANKLTTRRWMDGETLHVAIASATLKNDLAFIASSLVERINRLAGKQLVSKIVFH